MLDDLTDDQQVLLETSTRFIERTCPLARLRERAHDDRDFADDYRRRSAVVIRDEQLAAAPMRPPRDVRDVIGIVRVARAADDSGSSPSDARDDAMYLEDNPRSRNLHQQGV